MWIPRGHAHTSKEDFPNTSMAQHCSRQHGQQERHAGRGALRQTGYWMMACSSQYSTASSYFSLSMGTPLPPCSLPIAFRMIVMGCQGKDRNMTGQDGDGSLDGPMPEPLQSAGFP